MIKKEFLEKYDAYIEMGRKLGYSDSKINSNLVLMELLDNYEALKVFEVLNMDQIKLDNVLSVCWHEGNYRCHSIGIKNVFLEKNYLSWEDSQGEPSVHIKYMEKPIENIGNGEWNYGLYQKKFNSN
jgi:hypothetical protein